MNIRGPFSRLIPILILSLATLQLCGSLHAKDPIVARGQNGMVASVSEPATQIGVEILKQGGTAVDAAVAIAVAMQVTWPEAGNIGGGGFMMVHPGSGEAPVCIEYRETAPGNATAEMFKLSDSTYTCKAVGVPGTLRGLELTHQKYGKLPWKTLVDPAVKLAREGFTVDVGLANSLNGILRRIDKTEPYAEFLRVYQKPDGTDWQAGDRLVQPDLAETMSLIAEQGSDALYRGKVGDLLVAEMQRGNGIITKVDLAAYEAKVREPIHVRFRGYDVYGPPPPSSGGICLAEMLQILEQFDLRSQPRWSARNVHLQLEASRLAYLDRARYIGDADFVAIPPQLTTLEHAKQLAGSINPAKAASSRELAKDLKINGESDSTTHFSVIDGHGMAVSNTYTLEASYGSRVVVRGAGFLLNNEMGDFNWKAGLTTTTGRIGTEANLIAPHKRMLSSQTPVLVLKDKETILATGSPGGRTIINTVCGVLLNVLEYEMDLPTAVAQPRMHHQWLPDQARFERSAQEKFPELFTQLKQMGHRVKFVGNQGDVHSVGRHPQTGELQGVSDTRLSGAAAGY